MSAVNKLSSNGMKGILRQMPYLGVGRIVPSTSPSELSTFTQRGAYPGVPVLTSEVSSMFLKVSGTIPEDEVPFDVKTLRGGMVGLEEAQWIYEQAIDTELRPVINTGTGKGSIDTKRGWEWPSYVTYTETLVLDDDPDLEQLDAATTSDGRIWQAYRLYDTGTSVSVIVTVRALDGTWTDITVYESTDTTRTIFLPCLVVLPDDRVIVYLLNYTGGATSWQIQARVIEPVNLTVSDYEVACLKTTLDIATYGTPDFTSQLRGACKPDGSVVLLLSTEISTAYHILQLGSYDYGHSFSVVSYGSSASEEDTLPDIVYTQGVFVVSYVQAIDGGEGISVLIAVKTLSNFFDSLDTAPVLATFSEMADGVSARTVLGNALVATPDGILYNVNTVTNEDVDRVFGHMHVSLDLGASWETSAGDDKPNVGYDPDTPGASWLFFSTADAQETVARPRLLSATCQGNRVYVGLLFQKDSQTSDDYDDGSLVAFYLGGWSNQQKAFIDSLQKTSDGQISYKTTYFPFVDPEFNGWTLTTAGSEGAVISGSRRVITTADGGKHSYSVSGGTSVSTCSVEFDFNAGATFGTMSHGDVGVEIQIDNGTLKYQLGLYFLATAGTQGGIRLRDRVAGSTIADIPLDWEATEYTFKIELYNNRFQLFYRPASSSEDQVWERAVDPFDANDSYTGYTLTSTASTGASASVAWGHFFATTTGSTGDAVTRWRRVLAAFGTKLASSTAASGIKYWFIANYIDYATTDDFHNGYPFVAAPVWVRAGVYVMASGGPTYLGDSWEIRPAYQYPIENILPEGASAPGEVWESTTDDEEMVIYWLVGRGDVEAALADVVEEFPRNESLALWITRANFPTAALYGVNSSDVEVKILDINLVRFSGLTFSNHGDTLQILAGGGTTYIAPGELVGGHVLNSGETTPKLIIDNTDGQTNDDTKRTTITFESSGTETQGVDNDAGNKIFVPQGFFVCHVPPANQFKAYVLRIPAQETALGRFRCKVMFGPLDVFGIAPAFGFSTTLPQDNVLRQKTNAGHTEVRVYNGLPRVKALAWEALDQTRLDDLDPDYIQFAGASEPAALYDAAARQLYGLMQSLEGANELVVYCDKIPATTNTGELCPERFMYCRATSEFQESNRVGYEGVNEVVQVTNLVLEEEM